MCAIAIEKTILIGPIDTVHDSVSVPYPPLIFYVFIKNSIQLILQNKDAILKKIESVRLEEVVCGEATFLTSVHILKLMRYKCNLIYFNLCSFLLQWSEDI